MDRCVWAVRSRCVHIIFLESVAQMERIPAHDTTESELERPIRRHILYLYEHDHITLQEEKKTDVWHVPIRHAWVCKEAPYPPTNPQVHCLY